MREDRRRLLQGLAAMGGLSLLGAPVQAAQRARPRQRLPDFPFRLGVASGYPSDTSVVLWTRLAPDPSQATGDMPPLDWPVRYEVAADENFHRIVARGAALAATRFAHSVHIEVAGLSPGRHYWYRFMAGGFQSDTGRTRTLPSRRSDNASLHAVLACCQHYEHGRFAAWRHAASEAPDLVVHVGDYIYEGAPTGNRVRRHTGEACRTLDQYRQRYALYQSDAALQAAHRSLPWVLTWDDHEVANDYSGDRSGRDEDPVVFLARRAAAYQAWFEHLPVPPAMAPRADGTVALHRRLRIGRLATLHLLDQRQHRSPQACAQPGRAGGNRIGDACAERLEPGRSMLGMAQERWLEEGLRQDQAQWTLLAQGTLFTHLDELPDAPNQYWSDAWTGYPAARQRLIDALQRHRSRNPVLLSGDLHAFVAAGIRAVPERADTPFVATEFVATSISSDARAQDSLDQWRANNPHIRIMDGRGRGYLSLRLSRQHMQADVIALDDANRADSGCHRAHSCIVEAGRPDIAS